MNKNTFTMVLLSFIFACFLLFNLKLAGVILLMIICSFLIIRSELAIIKLYLFVYMVLVSFADESSFSASGNQSINLLGVLNVLLILILYFKLMDFCQLKKEYWNIYLIYPILLFMLYLMLTIPFSTSPVSTIRGLCRIFSGYSFYFITYFIIVKNKNAEEKIFKLITAVFIPILIYGIFEYFTGINILHNSSTAKEIYHGCHVIGSFNRVRTTFLCAPHYSFVILIYLPLYLHWYFIKRKGSSYFYGFILFLLLINLILTFTRITWIAVAIQIIFFLFLFRPKRILRFALPLFIVFVLISSRIISRITTVDDSAFLRAKLFWYGLSLFKAHPFIGSGYDTFIDLFTIQFGYKLAAHGDYMKMLAETGVFGFFGYLIILFTNLLFAVNNFKENDFAKVAFLTIIGFMVFSITDNGLSYSHIFYAILGLYNGVIVRESAIHDCKVAQDLSKLGDTFGLRFQTQESYENNFTKGKTK